MANVSVCDRKPEAMWEAALGSSLTGTATSLTSSSLEHYQTTSLQGSKERTWGNRPERGILALCMFVFCISVTAVCV